MTLPDDCENYTFLLVKVDVNLQTSGYADENYRVMGSRTILMWPNQTASVCYDSNEQQITMNLSGTSLKLSGPTSSTAIKAVVGFKCADLTA